LVIELLEEDSFVQKIRFEVKDTGIGMAEDFVSIIFNKFSQEYNASNRKYEGTGLGMAISNDLIRLMGGTLAVKSTKNKGTLCSFELTLPLGHPDSLKTNSSLIKEGTFSGKRVLLVEDNEMNRFIAKQSLDYLGFETVEAQNGLIATEIIQEQSFDLILMDIQMPVMDGVEVTTFIRKNLKINIPIIALTANAFKHDIDLYLKKGMNDFNTKPYDEQDFFRKIEHLLSLAYDVLKIDSISETAPTKTIIPLYDLSSLEKMSRGNKEFVTKMIKIFISLVAENTAALESALENDNIDSIKKIAHKIKPSIDQMGIASLTEVVRQIEKYDFNTGTQDEFISMAQKLINVLRDVVIELENK